MKLIKEESRYVILNTHEIKGDDEMSDILSCFLDENSLILFSCLDIDYFFKHLDEQDQQTQQSVNQLIEFNRINYGKEGILSEGKKEEERRHFVNERTVFINKESGIPFPHSNSYHRQIIWFKTLNKSEIIKAIQMDYLFLCIILKNGSDFYDYEYAIEQFETEDGKAMFIKEKEKGNFEKYIYPRICKKYMLS